LGQGTPGDGALALAVADFVYGLVEVIRSSFLVRLLHPLLSTGFDRRFHDVPRYQNPRTNEFVRATQDRGFSSSAPPLVRAALAALLGLLADDRALAHVEPDPLDQGLEVGQVGTGRGVIVVVRDAGG
jgi:hypothetical protein